VQFSTVAESGVWIKNHSSGPAIAVLPASQADAAAGLLAAGTGLTPVWTCEAGGIAPAGARFLLRQPFPPAALAETVKEAERLIPGNNT